MNEITEKSMNSAFMGKPYEVEMTGNDGEKYKFTFKQFKVDRLPEFIPLINEYVKSNGQITTTLMEMSIPFVKKMV